MQGCFVVSDNIVSPLGLTTAENFGQLLKGVSGIKQHSDTGMSAQPFYAALFDEGTTFINDSNNSYTKFEQLLIASISDALSNCDIQPADKKTALIISSTKGNISLVETETYSVELKERVALHTSAKMVAGYFGFVTKPLVVSNACISGLLAILTGMRLIQSGQYENVVVAGADVITKFVLSGFQSFQAVSPVPCKPFDIERSGISLGEGASTVILSGNKKYANGIEVLGGSVSNDANHISGPSRTGEELALVIDKALQQAGLQHTDIDFISAHGTATPYNDEMEAKAIALSGLQTTPVNSLKGYYGHTLGAAGLVESVISIQSLKQNVVLPSKGVEELGVTKPINVTNTLLHGSYKYCLKTASGFGGCNAALVFGKTD
jgi:3-oxoacyl-[acyl-carrier-protein] synthase-1